MDTRAERQREKEQREREREQLCEEDESLLWRENHKGSYGKT